MMINNSTKGVYEKGNSKNQNLLSPENFRQRLINVKKYCDILDLIAESVLKESIKDPIGVQNLHIILPTRRACRRLEELIIKKIANKDNHVKTTLLPKLIAIGSISAEQFGFHDVDTKNIIDNYDRILLLTNIIVKRYPDYGISHAMKFAKGIIGLIDDFNYNSVNFDEIKTISTELDMNQHWADIMDFLNISFEVLPDLMEKIEAIHKSYHDMAQLIRVIEYIQSGKGRFITAGICGENYLSRSLQKAMHQSIHDNCLIVLQENIGNTVTEKDETSPTNEKFSLVRLLDEVGVDKDRLAPNTKVSDADTDYNDNNNFLEKFRDKISLIECPSIDDEAITIALMLNEYIANNKDQDATLVTADFDLARRVMLQLENLGIRADSSIGSPLAKSAIGIYVNLLANFLTDNDSNEKLLSLIKSPYFIFPAESNDKKTNRKDHLKHIRKIEYALRKNNTFAKTDEHSSLKLFKESIKSTYKDLQELATDKKLSLSLMLEIFIKLITKYANKETFENRNEESELLLSVLEKLQNSDFAKSIMIQKSKIDELPYILNFILYQENFRQPHSTDTRVRILTPTEAKLIKSGRTIIGGMNDAPWISSVVGSGTSGDDFLLNTAIRKKLGLPTSSEYIGLLKRDFIDLCHSSDEIFITRSTHTAGSINLESRWLLEIKSELKGKKLLNGCLQNWQNKQEFYLGLRDIILHDTFDRKAIEKATKPQPKPPLESRPKEVYATHIERLIEDPYEFYVRKILKLQYIPMLGENMDQLDKGIIFHKIMEKFIQQKNYSLGAFTNISDQILQSSTIETNLQKFWQIRLKSIAAWMVPEVINILQQNKTNKFYTEISGSYKLDNSITIKANADRIDVRENDIVIIDYKTGSAPSPQQIKELKKPQLLIEALIAKGKGFDIYNQDKKNIKISCWRINSSKKEIISYEKLDIEQLIKETENFLNDLSQKYLLSPNTPFTANEKNTSSFDNPYQHLSRVKEWANP